MYFMSCNWEKSKCYRKYLIFIAPEGFEKPTVYQIRSHDIRIVWEAPRVPNGRIVNYTIVA